MSLIRSVATVGGFTLISRVLGFGRDLLIAAVLGAGPVADAFFVAFRLPNLFRRLFAEGAFNAAFVPQFARALAETGWRAAHAFAEQVLAVMLAVLLVLTLFAELFMPALVIALAPGFAADPDKLDMAVHMARLTFPYLLFMTLTAVMAGVLNGLGRFAAAAGAPILLNLFMIGALVLSVGNAEAAGNALAIAVALAGAGQLVLMAVACKRAGMPLALPRPQLTPRVRRMLKLMLPGAIGAGVMQINLLIGTIIASLLPTGAIAWLYYADRIYQLPLGVVGIAVGTALLPRLAHALKSGNRAEADENLNRALEIALFFTLPAAVALLVVPGTIVGGLFERGAFGAEDTVATARALAAYALGLPAFVLVKVLAPAFFARENTRTPVIVAAIAVAANIALGLALYRPMGHVGLALATTIASWVNALLLAELLRREDALVLDRRLVDRSRRILVASLAMAAVLWGAEAAASDLLASGASGRLAGLALICAIGLAAYLAIAFALGAISATELRTAMRRGQRPRAADAGS